MRKILNYVRTNDSNLEQTWKRSEGMGVATHRQQLCSSVLRCDIEQMLDISLAGCRKLTASRAWVSGGRQQRGDTVNWKHEGAH